jgi:tetratricopeptide (TPR) repeat protein
MYGRAEQHEKARDAFREAIKIQPDFAEAHYNLGVALQHLGEFYPVMDSYKAAIKLMPDLACAHFNLGFFFLDHGHRFDASICFARALKIEVTPAYARMAGWSLASQGHWKEAIAAYQKGLEVETDSEGRKRVEEQIKKIQEEHVNVKIKYTNAPPLEYNVEMGGDYTTPAQARGSSELRHTLPPLPDGLSWPQEDFDQSTEFGKRGGLVRYLKVWKPLIAAGVIDMPTLRKFYPKAAKAVDNHRQGLPAELTIPTIKQVNDQALASEWIRVEDIGRLARARQRRLVKGRQQPRPSS